MATASPSKTIAFLGDGQLAWMLSDAAIRLGIRSLILGENDGQLFPTSHLRSHIKWTSHNSDHTSLDKLNIDVATFETENIDLGHVAKFFSENELIPNLKSVAISQDRLLEKKFCTELGIPTTKYYEVKSKSDLLKHWTAEGTAAILKTRRGGYDGKGQWSLSSRNDAENIPEEVFTHPHGFILEKKLAFDAECSIISCRGANGEIVHYPLSENFHRNGILRWAASCNSNDPRWNALQEMAESVSRRVLEQLNYVGTFAIEFFIAGNKLLVNEFAPRVHNSGHWTLNAATVCQFENHVRAISGLRIAQPHFTAHHGMVNIIGGMPDLDLLLNKFPGVSIYDYRKEARPNRKLGHIKISESDPQSLRNHINELVKFIA